MRTIQIIKNQYDNIMKPFIWDAKIAKNFIESIKHPIIVEQKDMIPQWKICTTNGELRRTDNMGLTDILILDFDDSNYSIKRFENNYREYRYILHTSHSYDGINQKFRVFLFLDKEYELNRLFFKGYHKQFSPYYFLINYFEFIDPASFVKAQFFKVPAVKQKNAPYYYSIHDGKLFNIEQVLGFEFKMAYENCIEKQNSYLRKLEKQVEYYRKKNGNDLSKAKQYVEEKIENCPIGGRHNQIFSLACWWKKIGGTFTEFEQIMPSWADRDFSKQMYHLQHEWVSLK